MAVNRLPEKEYLKIAKLIGKYEVKMQTAKQVQVVRIAKKVDALLTRAEYLEDQMMVPDKRRFTHAYR